MTRVASASGDSIPLDLPNPHGSPWMRALRWRFASVYRRIFAVIFILNLSSGLIAFALLNFGKDFYASGGLVSEWIAIAVSANLMCAILIRNEHVINLVFRAFTSPIMGRAPVWFRRRFAMVYSYGGFHSGCGVAAAIWFCVYTGVVHREYIRGYQQSVAFVVLSYLTLLLLGLILILAYPRVRAKWHNSFELTHRFVGWTVLGLFWGLVVISAVSKGKAEQRTTASALIRSPPFWFIVVATICVIYPWTRLRRHEVEVEPLSDHAVCLHFKHCQVHHSVVRLTDRPLIETHSFAAIPDANEERGFSCIISAAGDWTRKIITNPPSHLYILSGFFHGMTTVAKLFTPVVFIATGSGIAPCLAFFLSQPGHEVRIIWSTKNPEKTYSHRIIEAVLKADPKALIIDTDVHGRPNLVNLAYQVYAESKAEGICIVSNPRMVRHLVYAMESRNVPAYGPIWDS